MSFYVSRPFGEKIARLERKHRRLMKGGVTVMRPDGLMVLEPRRNGLRRAMFFFTVLAVALIAFKAIVYHTDGQVIYEARIERLAQGTGPEAVAAQIMTMDPITQIVVETMAPTIDRAGLFWRDVRSQLLADYWATSA